MSRSGCMKPVGGLKIEGSEPGVRDQTSKIDFSMLYIRKGTPSSDRIILRHKRSSEATRLGQSFELLLIEKPKLNKHMIEGILQKRHVALWNISLDGVLQHFTGNLCQGIDIIQFVVDSPDHES